MFKNKQQGPLKLPITMSENAHNLIVQLLNRNPLTRLGSGSQGVKEIMKHPFFEKVDWYKALTYGLQVYKPKKTVEVYEQKFKNVRKSPNETIFDEIYEEDEDMLEMLNTDIKERGEDPFKGWSFIGADREETFSRSHKNLMDL
jgi:serine/threonine protein kinase